MGLDVTSRPPGRPAQDERRPDPALRTADFEYELPEELIAQRPADRRDASRLLVVRRSDGSVDDRTFPDLLELIPPGDVLVLNDTRVFPARLVGQKPTGARAEILLLQPREDDRHWEAIVRPGGKLKPGRRVIIGDGLEIAIEDSLPGGGRLVCLECEGDPWAAIERHGRVPLPPYIRREDDAEDRSRYQTVYAARAGSIAAPTAGLHFTGKLLEELEARGVTLVRITLHVGIGTFRPVDAERLEEHELHAERFHVEPQAASRLNSARSVGASVWAVGSTVCRTLEASADPDGQVREGGGWTDLFIHPPYRFRVVDRLLTNFHLPRSSLLMLVSAFAGHRLTMQAYRHAIEERYRFYSYGDAMLVI
jgi:S-adenosylmethionine:tRNA ribosyltransferase-isomerase